VGKRVAVQPQKTAGRGKASAKPGLRLQRKCACGGASGQTCGCDEHDGRKLPIRRRALTHDAPDVVPAIVHEVLRSEGRPLEEGLRAFMESRLGHNFTHVRVHTDAPAAESARAVGALAYTVGKDVVFASGQYRPETREGRRLLAHELAHVIQQGDGGRFDGKLEVGPSDGPEERAADEAAAAVEASPVVPSPATAAATRPPRARSAPPVLRRKTGDAASWFRGLFSSLILGTFGFPDSWLQEYLEKLDKTGDIEGDPDSDDKAREIVNTWRKGGGKFILTAQRKALLIHELLDGPTMGGDEDAILELLVRSFNYELTHIFGAGGVDPKRLSEDIPDEPGDRLFEFFVDRCEGGHEAALAGNFKPKGAPPVPLGVELPPVGAVISNVELFKGGSTGWDVRCVLGLLCSEDQAVVSQLPSLDVKMMERIDVKQWKFDGKSWSSQTVHPVGVNKPDKKLVGIVKTADCNSAAQTLFHEVRHQNQTEDVRKTHFTMEVDAYTETEKWAIARGLPETSPGESLRSTDPRSGAQSPSAKAIEAKVTRIYGGPTDVAGEEVKGHEGANTTLVEVNGKPDKRQSKDTDKYLEEPPTFVGEQPLFAKEWKCPEQKPGPLIQRKCACGGEAGTAGECEECARKRAPGLQPKLNVSQPGDRFEAEADLLAERITRMPDQLTRAHAPGLQRQAVTPVGHSHGELAEAPPAVQEVLRSPGRPLDAQTRGFMESRFGHDFSQVRVHTDARADSSARAVDALSYTVGRNVVFAEGQYAPATSKGRRLLAHELTHVLQQGGGRGVSRADGLVHRQSLQRQPANARKKAKILSVAEINADSERKKNHQFVGAPPEAKVCDATNPDPTKGHCKAVLKPGAEVTVISGKPGAGWLEIENTGDFKPFGPAQKVFILGVFAKDVPVAAPKPPPAPAAAPASPEAESLSESPESPIMARIKKRRDSLPSKVRWTPPNSSPQVGRTRLAIDLLTVAKDFYFNEPTDRETADTILAKVKKNFSDAYLTDSNFDKKFRDLSGLTRTDTRMLLQAGRGSLDTLIGKIKSGQVQPGNAGGEATFQYHLNAFISAHDVMEVLAGDLELKDAKNIQTLEVAASGKGIIAFGEGVLEGLKSKLAEDDYKTISKKMLVSGIPVLGQSVFLAGATVGIAKDIYEALKGLYEMVRHPGEMITNIAQLIGTLITDEESARAMGFVLGEEKSKEIKAMAGEDIVTFTYKLGVLIGPTIVYAILWLTGAGEAMTAAAVERMGLVLKRFPKVVSALEKIEKGLEKVKAALPKRKTVKAAEEAEQLAAGAGKAAKKVEGAGKVAKDAEQAGKVAKGAEHAAEDAGAAAKDARKATAAESGVAADAKAEAEAAKAGKTLAEESMNGHEYKVLEDGSIIRCSDRCGPLRNRLKDFKRANPRARGVADLEEELEEIERIANPKKKARAAAEFDKKLEEFISEHESKRAGATGRKVTESSGAAETNVPPERHPVEIEATERGNILEDEHIKSKPEYYRPKAKDFEGIDAWKEGDKTRRTWKTLPDGTRELTISKPSNVLQVKSVGKGARIAPEVKEGIAGLDSDLFKSRTDKTLRIINPETRTLDVIFEEGAVPDVNKEVRAIMRSEAEKAGLRGIEIRWYRWSNSFKKRITY
jgi:hypothetical protein